MSEISKDKLDNLSFVKLRSLVLSSLFPSSLSFFSAIGIKDSISLPSFLALYQVFSEAPVSINILLLCFMGAIVPASFFMGSYLLFMLAIIFFTFCVFTVSISGVNYYVIASEIRNLKFITGYKMSNEIELPSLNDITKINVKMKKSRN